MLGVRHHCWHAWYRFYLMLWYRLYLVPGTACTSCLVPLVPHVMVPLVACAWHRLYFMSGTCCTSCLVPLVPHARHHLSSCMVSLVPICRHMWCGYGTIVPPVYGATCTASRVLVRSILFVQYFTSVCTTVLLHVCGSRIVGRRYVTKGRWVGGVQPPTTYATLTP